MSSDNNPTIEAYAAQIAKLEREIEDWKKLVERQTRHGIDAADRVRSRLGGERDSAIKALGEEARKRGLVEAQRDRYRDMTLRLLAVVETLVPGARYLAIESYSELADAPLAARRLLEENAR